MNNNVIGPSNMNDGNNSFNNMNNNVTTSTENNKRGFNKIFFIFLVLVLMAVTGFAGWKLGTMHANNEDNNIKEEQSKDEKDPNENEDESEDEKDTDEDVLAKNDKYSFYKEVSADILLNGENVTVLTYFYLDKEVLILDESEDEEQKVTRYVLRRDVFVENNKILDGVIASVLEDDKDADTTIGYFNITLEDIDTFNDTSNSEEYMVLYLSDSDNIINGKTLVTRYDPSVDRAYIVNAKGDLLKTIDYSNDIWGLVGIFANKDDIGDRNYVNTNTIYSDMADMMVYGDYMLYTEGVIDFHDSFIYYVTGDCIEFKEYKFSITDGKVKDEYIKTYSGDSLDVVGGC